MKTLALLSTALLIGCAPLVSQQQQAQFDETFRYRLIDGCPTSEPLAHRARLAELEAQYAQHKDIDRLAASLLNACPGLSEDMRKGYWILIQAAAQEHDTAMQYAAAMERQRRSAHVQRAGRTMMEIKRTDDLDRIRRNQEAFD